MTTPVAGPAATVTVTAPPGALPVTALLTAAGPGATIALAAPAGGVGGDARVLVAGPAARITLRALRGFQDNPGTVRIEAPAATVNVVALPSEEEPAALDRTDWTLTMTMLSDIVNSPGVLRVSVGNGVPGGLASFFIDDSATAVHIVELDDTGAARPVEVPVTELLAGGHLLRVSADPYPPAPGPRENLPFTVVESYDTIPDSVDVGQEPPIPVAPGRWVFQAYDFSDPDAVDTYVLSNNPSQMDRSFGGHAITDEPTTVSNGKTISWEGAPKPPLWTFTGNILNEPDYRALLRWGQTGQRFYITDHFGQRYLVKCVMFEVTRRRDLQRPWNHTYSMQVQVLRGAGVLE